MDNHEITRQRRRSTPNVPTPSSRGDRYHFRKTSPAASSSQHRDAISRQLGLAVETTLVKAVSRDDRVQPRQPPDLTPVSRVLMSSARGVRAYDHSITRPDDNNWGTLTADRSAISKRLPLCRRRHHRWRNLGGIISIGAMSGASRHDESFIPPISTSERL
jgi:hypothetical protein